MFRSLTASGAGIKGPRQLVSAIATMRRPVALVIDHLEAVTNQDSLDAVAALALGLPTGFAAGDRFAGRVATPDGTAAGARRAAGGRDRRAGDGTRQEAAALLSRAGVELARIGAGRAGRSRPRGGRPACTSPRSPPRRADRTADGGDVHRRRPVHRRLPAVGVPRSGVARAGVVPHPIGDPRAHVRSAV